jgi:hypothetical protein
MNFFSVKPQYAAAIKWHRRGSCGEPGCRDHPECACSFCGLPIGVPEGDERWHTHDPDCGDCDLCRDQVPIILFRGEGKQMEQAQFHIFCFKSIVHFRSHAG